jgi:methionyl aminopeptidase
MERTFPLDEPDGRLTKDGIRIHQHADFAGMHRAGRVAAEILDAVAPLVEPGVTTETLDDFIRAEVGRRGAVSATIGYRGYQHASCISVNHVVCHGIPGDEGSEGRRHPQHRRHGHCRWLVRRFQPDVCGGEMPRKAERLIEVTHDALMRGIEAVKPGNTFGDIGHAIQSYVEANRMSVVRDFCGHGLGRVFHDAAERPALRPRRHEARRARGRHVLHHRADGEPGPAGNQGSVRRLDRP